MRAVRMAGRLPEALDERLVAAAAGRPVSRVPAVQVPSAPVRLYVAPANFAGQGFAWARAVEDHLPGVAARNMAPLGGGRFSYPADYSVPEYVAAGSRRWQRAQRAAVEQFTHVLVEAELPLFPRLGDGSVLSEVRALRRSGVHVATICHGSDIRPPSVHAASSPWSPFLDPKFGDETAKLEQATSRNLRLLETLRDEGTFAFVSTPALLEYVPWASWCPVVVDVERWRTEEEPLRRPVPVVVHAPSKGVIKGTALIEPVLWRLHEEKIIEYRQAKGLDHDQMVDLYRSADVVLDSFRTGNYGVATCEALAAGRVVVARLDDGVRSAARRARGMEIPVVEADPSTLRSVLEDILRDRDRFRTLAAQGPEFVRDLHDGAASARALASFLGVPETGRST